MNFVLQTCLLLSVYAPSFAEANGDPLSCETFYENSQQRTIFCKKARNGAVDMSSSYKKLKEICAGTERSFVAEDPRRDGWTFASIDCELRREIFDSFGQVRVRKFISHKNNQNSVLRNDAFTSLCNVREIHMSVNGIKGIQSGAFDCTQGLVSLDLSYNDIQLLPVDIFKFTQRLQSLCLNNNRIHLLTREIFDNLLSLERLDLGSNLIRQLPNGVFQNLKSLRVLDLGTNEIKTFEDDTFSNLKDLEYLSLRGNNLKHLRDGCFLEQEKLTEMDIGKNVGFVVTKESFARLKHLQVLRMDDCNLTSLDGDPFLQIPELSELDLHGNLFQEIPFKMFRSGKNDSNFDNANCKIEILDLSFNNFRELKSDSFRGLSSLRHLNISSNSIWKIAPNCFEDVRKLTVLNISHNILSPVNGVHSLQKALSYLPNLEKLDMSNCSLEQFTIVFPVNSKTLVELDMSRNVGLDLEVNPFINLQKLEILHVRDCNISSLTTISMLEDSSSLFSMYNKLHGLMLNGSHLHPDDTEPGNYIFFNNDALKEIDLSGNELTEIKQSNLRPLQFLQRLDLSRNLIESIDNVNLDDFRHLQFLNLSHNYIAHTPETSFSRKNGLSVDISYNMFTDINWKALMFADTVWVASNKIKDLFVTEISPLNNFTMHLEGNDIEGVHFDSNLKFPSAGAKIRIHLKGNPLKCDCHMFELYELLNRGFLPQVDFADGLICLNPPKLRERELANLSGTDFACDVKKNCPENCHCECRASDSSTVVNCNRRDYQQLPLYVPSNTSILFISQNRLTSLGSLKEAQWENLTEVHAEMNLIVSEEFHIPKKLRLLVLNSNRMKTLPNALRRHAETKRDFLVEISDNPWSCDCASIGFKAFLSEHRNQVKDASKMRCTFSNDSESGVSLIQMIDKDLCPRDRDPGGQRLSTSINVFIIVLTLMLIVFLLVYYNRKYMLKEF